jgi:DNA replication protein DnaC
MICRECCGVGYVRYEVPVGHEKFGKLESCVCRARDVAASARSRLFTMSNLECLGNLNFENFNASGNEKARFMTPQERESLRQAFEVCEEFAYSHAGWLLLEGGYGCGKTHLAAAIGNYRIALGGQALLVEVSALFDYLRQSFHASSNVSFDRRFQEIRAAPLLLLDDLKESNMSSAWTEDRLHGLLNYRYNLHQPTVLTSALSPDAFALSYPSLWNKLSDSSRCQIVSIHMPPYRRTNPTHQGKREK